MFRHKHFSNLLMLKESKTLVCFFYLMTDLDTWKMIVDAMNCDDTTTMKVMRNAKNLRDILMSRIICRIPKSFSDHI